MEVLLKDENLTQKDNSKDLIFHSFLSENATDPQRLFISQFLTTIIIQQDTINKSFYTFLINELIILQHKILNHLIGEYEQNDIKIAISNEPLPLESNYKLLHNISELFRNQDFNKYSKISLFKVFSGVLDCLERLLTPSSGYNYQIPLLYIFEVFYRILDVSTTKIKEPKNSKNLYLNYFKSLKVTIFNFVKLLIQICGNEIFIIYDKLSEIIIKNLKDYKQLSEVRSGCYEVLSSILSINGISAVKKFEEHVIRAARLEFSNILNEKEKKEESKINRISNKKQKRKLSNKVRMDTKSITMSIITSYYEKKKLEEVKEEVVDEIGIKSCLNLIGHILKYGAGMMTRSIRYELESIIAQIIINDKLTKECEMMCYEVLLMTVLSPVEHRPRLLPWAIMLLRDGRHHEKWYIRDFCLKNFDKVEAIIHPKIIYINENSNEIIKPNNIELIQNILRNEDDKVVEKSNKRIFETIKKENLNVKQENKKMKLISVKNTLASDEDISLKSLELEEETQTPSKSEIKEETIIIEDTDTLDIKSDKTSSTIPDIDSGTSSST